MLAQIIQFVGEDRALEIAGIRLVGMNAQNGGKLLFSIVFVTVVVALSRLLRRFAPWLLRRRVNERIHFWTSQAINLATALLLLIGLASVWFDDPSRLATALGLVSAGLAFALQKVVTAFAGYAVILRGKTFNVGDRIRMGGVRGDVIALSFIQTTIMEMGQPPETQSDEPEMWVTGRQYTGRIVTLTNDKIFEEPVYNYTREFPYIWEEMRFPIPYESDHARVEQLILQAANRHTIDTRELSRQVLEEMQRRYFISSLNTKPQVFWRMTSNWLEMTLRFLANSHQVREMKNALTREILAGLDTLGVSIASSTFGVVELPPVRVQLERSGQFKAGSRHEPRPPADDTAGAGNHADGAEHRRD